MSAQRAKVGNLSGTTPELYPVGDLPLPITIVLRSSSASRAIGLSFDGGIETFNIGTMDQSSSTEMVLHVTVPCTHVAFTGAAGDAWSIIWNKINI